MIRAGAWRTIVSAAVAISATEMVVSAVKTAISAAKTIVSAINTAVSVANEKLDAFPINPLKGINREGVDIFRWVSLSDFAQQNSAKQSDDVAPYSKLTALLKKLFPSVDPKHFFEATSKSMIWKFLWHEEEKKEEEPRPLTDHNVGDI